MPKKFKTFCKGYVSQTINQEINEMIDFGRGTSKDERRRIMNRISELNHLLSLFNMKRDRSV